MRTELAQPFEGVGFALRSQQQPVPGGVQHCREANLKAFFCAPFTRQSIGKTQHRQRGIAGAAKGFQLAVAQFNGGEVFGPVRVIGGSQKAVQQDRRDRASSRRPPDATIAAAVRVQAHD